MKKKIKIKFDFLQPFLLYILLIITQKEKNVYIFCHTLDEVKCLSFFAQNNQYLNLDEKIWFVQ